MNQKCDINENKRKIAVNVSQTNEEEPINSYIKEHNVMKGVPATMLPTLEWQMKTLEDFINFRTYIHFIIDTEANPTITWFNQERFFINVHYTTPLFAEMSTYNQACKIRMLELISEHLASQRRGYKINSVMGAWLYGILTLLDVPLSANWCYTVREFGRQCIAIRAALDDDATEADYKPLNFFICIVARFYGQLDLADP